MVVVGGAHEGNTRTEETLALPKRPEYLRDLTNAAVDGTFLVEINSDLRINREKFKDVNYFK